MGRFNNKKVLELTKMHATDLEKGQVVLRLGVAFAFLSPN
jgi:hypothetical protein